MTPPNDAAVQEVRKKTPSDFIFGKVIGEGSFSVVYLAKDVQTHKEFASELFLFLLVKFVKLHSVRVGVYNSHRDCLEIA